ncbi:MAG: hypothetical protein MR051_06245 [Lentisphaeria bacterium]|nr:hypothetical protein [Lentisphaeria bacterium]
MFKQKVLLAVAALSLTGVAVQAAPWFSHNSRRTPKTLSVVGNYKTPRLMAETILSLTRQPYLLIASDGRYFIVMSKDVQEVPKSKLDVYINNLNPQRLVILGDERYVSRAEEMNLRRINLRRIPIVRIYGNNWTRIAEELDDMLNIGNLARNFNRNYYDMQLSDPRLREAPAPSAAAAPAEPMAAAEPAAVPANRTAEPEKEKTAPEDMPVAEPVGQ